MTVRESVRVEFASKHDLERARQELVLRSGMSIEELRERGSRYDVTVEQRDILAEIEGLEFLLGDDD